MMDERLKACMTQLSFEEAKEKLPYYTYLLRYEISSMKLDAVEAVAEINWDACRELYAFGTDGQLHMFRDEEDGAWAAVEFKPEGLNMVERTYELAAQFAKGDKNAVLIGEYLSADKDGQVYVAYTALRDLVKGGKLDE